ncbi:MAG TPA: phage/plasmid primase, P4 family, partial [Isosphaeraceae bacterium]
PDGPTLHFWQGDYVEWDGCWRPVFSGDLLARAHWAAKVEFDRLNRKAIAAAEADRRRRGLAPPAPEELPRTRKVTAALVANVALALSGYTRLDPRTPQPSWLEGPGPFPAEDVVPARNALVYLPGLVRGDQCSILRPTPRFFAPYCLDYDFDPAAPEPVKWFCFLGSLWPDDPESIAALQEWFGLLLTPDTTYQKILLLIGPRRSGKGTIARVIRALIGPSNVANPTLASLATNFGVTPLIGSPAAVVTDARLSGRADIAQVVERLLSISGEDAQTIDRKHLPAITVKLPTRFALLSNELPPLTDASGSLAGRLIILRLTRSFYDAEDRILTEDLLTELPSILLWSIEGWRRLRERGRLVQPEAGKAMIEEMEDLGSPVRGFLKDQCKVGPEAKVMAAELYGAWKAWCQEHGRDNAGDAQGFGRNLRAAIPGLNTTQPRQDDGSRPRFYMGVRLLDPDEDPD